ncbi:MAG: zinc dependent phospholipase C family protein [Clostridia bacterium]|nr:zinc dependent phospholipase C family protein [Clostridia bacterium]
MPDQLAHYLFARRVWAAAGELKPRIDPASPAFRAGSFGPDPLFNDFSSERRSQGFGMHRRPGREALEKLREPLKQNLPGAADYAAGFFTHYALDRLCHPDLKAMDARGEAKHVPTETAYDRALYLRGGCRLPRHIILSESACRIAAGMYEGVSARQFRLDLAAYWKLRRMLILGGGTKIADIADRLNPAWKGIVPSGTPSEGTLRGIKMLDGLLDAGVPIAAVQLERFFHAVENDLPLDGWTDFNFAGSEVSKNE